MKFKTSTLVLVSLALIVAGILVLAYVFLSTQVSSTPVPYENPSNPFGGITSGSQEGTVERVLIAKDGTEVTVSDFAKDKPSVLLGETPNDKQFDLTPYPAYELDTPYQAHAFDVQFNQLDSVFVVTLNEEPLGASRLAAEEFLKSTLNLNESKLCTLATHVGVPFSVNESLSVYENLGLSFCPQAYPLP